MRKSGLFWLYQSAQGQGGLVAVAVTIVIALVIGATSLSGLSVLGAKRTIATKQTLQTYYAAQAGIQEALASRMLPRNNYMNFANPSKQYYTRSGRIYQDPSTTSSGVIALYRYVIVGGDAARASNGNYYPENNLNPSGIPRLLATNTIPTDGSFIIISNGITCTPRDRDSVVVADEFNLSNPLNPTCNSRFRKDEITLVAQARLAQETASGAKIADKIERMRVYKNNSRIRLPASAFVPGYGWTGTSTDIDFQRVWTYDSDNDANPDHNPLKLELVVFYDFSDNTIYDVIEVNNATVAAGTYPSNAAIRLYFNGPIDYRTISPTVADVHLDGCQPQPPTSPNQQDNCNIRVVPNPPMSGANHAYAGNTTVPLFPGSTQVILLPPLTNTLAGGTPHRIEVDTTKMRSYNDSPGPEDYEIDFTTE